MTKILIFSIDTLVSKEIEDSLSEYFTVSCVSEESSFENVCDEDLVVVILSEFTSKLGNFLRKSSVDVIDFTGLADSYTSRCLPVSEPSVYLLEQIFGSYISEIRGNIYYPASVFGKAGIDDLIEQTRSIFTMTSNENKILDFNIPFNGKIGYGFGNSSLLKYIESYNYTIPQNFDLRLIPFSTNLVIDVFKPEYMEIDLPHLNRCVDISSELSDSQSGFVAFEIDNQRITVLADYIKVIKKQVFDKITEITGVML